MINRPVGAWAVADVAPVLEWLDECRQRSCLGVRRIDAHECLEWSLIEGEIRHSSGRYFQIVGTRVEAGDYSGWCRPMIRQHEIGTLGFLVSEADGDVAWLVQAKTEPGNVGGTQLAPTVQATESNQDRVHGGRPTRYLEWFTGNRGRGHTYSSLLASEQGTRFLGKRNRNATVLADAARVIPADNRWCWLDRSTLRELLGHDFIVNSDARSVIATSPWRLIAAGSQPFAAGSKTDEFGSGLAKSYALTARPDMVIRALEARRTNGAPLTRKVPIHGAGGWRIDGSPIDINDDVAFVEVRVEDREVDHWHQPLLTSQHTEYCDLYAQIRNGVALFLFRHRAEPGLRNIVELGPTRQSDRGILAETPIDPPSGRVRLSVSQSDEGSRFLECVVHYRIIEIEPGVTFDVDGGVWLSLADIEALVSRPGIFTNEARTTISLLLSRS